MKLMIFILISLSVTSVHSKVRKSSLSGSNFDLKQEMSFSGKLVNGKYQFSEEAVATVENDKYLEDLLGLPKDFKQRNRRMKARY